MSKSTKRFFGKVSNLAECFVRDRAGGTAIEYAVISFGVSICAMVALATTGSEVGATLELIGGAFNPESGE